MKKSTTDAKKAAANDKPEVENGKPRKAAPKAKAEKPVERYTIGNFATVRGGFYKDCVTTRLNTAKLTQRCCARSLSGDRSTVVVSTLPECTDTFGMR